MGMNKISYDKTKLRYFDKTKLRYFNNQNPPSEPDSDLVTLATLLRDQSFEIRGLRAELAELRARTAPPMPPPAPCRAGRLRA